MRIGLKSYFFTQIDTHFSNAAMPHGNSVCTKPRNGTKMRLTSLPRWLLLAAVASACTQTPDDESREHLVSALRDRLGKNASPSVGFLNNRKHLQVSLSAAAFADSADSTFADRAKDIARFSLASYSNATGLDSVTVSDRDSVAKG